MIYKNFLVSCIMSYEKLLTEFIPFIFVLHKFLFGFDILGIIIVAIYLRPEPIPYFSREHEWKYCKFFSEFLTWGTSDFILLYIIVIYRQLFSPFFFIQPILSKSFQKEMSYSLDLKSTFFLSHISGLVKAWWYSGINIMPISIKMRILIKIHHCKKQTESAHDF